MSHAAPTRQTEAALHAPGRGARRTLVLWLATALVAGLGLAGAASLRPDATSGVARLPSETAAPGPPGAPREATPVWRLQAVPQQAPLPHGGPALGQLQWIEGVGAR